MPNDVTVVILAAGQGTRMKSRLAKVLHRAAGRTLVEHAIAAAGSVANPEGTFVVVGHQAEAVRIVVEATGAGVIHQTEQLGTGHAVMCGREQLVGLGSRLVVFYGDCPMIRPETIRLVVDAQAAEGAALSMITTRVKNPTGYGRILRGSNGDVIAIVEHKAATPEQLLIDEINPGIYCFDAQAFWHHVGELTTNNPAGEYYLTDMVDLFVKAGRRVTAHVIEDSSELEGVNDRVQLAAAEAVLRDRKRKTVMLSGVTIENPETVAIDVDVTVGMDTVIGPHTQITGATTIGENCRIAAGSIIDESILGNGVQVHPYTLISNSTLEDGAEAGPFARIRMNAVLRRNAKVGNFVELKKTDFGEGSKSMHLAYLGDASIGSGVNIGAGTITCNYDGEKKHRTYIGDKVFVGSNSTLVAPVEIEKGAYIGAGSVITDDVPEEALALGRGRQVIKPDWLKKKREQKSS